MDIAQTIGRKEPDVVYHYTTSAGFLGITTSKSLWATNIHYLNDNKEFLHSLDLFKEELYRRKKLVSADKVEILDFLSASFEPIKELKLFVCSFTEEGDLLSQWRGYCPDGGGISLGFEFQKIKKCAQQQGYRIGPCIYEHKEKVLAITKILDMTLPNIESMFGKAPEHNIRGYFYQNVILLAPFMKHPSFKEEKEWRCSLFPSLEQLQALHYRSGKTVIIPYHEIQLMYEDKFSIKHIIIGPSEHRKLQSNAVSDVLHNRGVEWGQLSFSSTPYRQW